MDVGKAMWRRIGIKNTNQDSSRESSTYKRVRPLDPHEVQRRDYSNSKASHNASRQEPASILKKTSSNDLAKVPHKSEESIVQPSEPSFSYRVQVIAPHHQKMGSSEGMSNEHIPPRNYRTGTPTSGRTDNQPFVNIKLPTSQKAPSQTGKAPVDNGFQVPTPDVPKLPPTPPLPPQTSQTSGGPKSSLRLLQLMSTLPVQVPKIQQTQVDLEYTRKHITTERTVFEDPKTTQHVRKISSLDQGQDPQIISDYKDQIEALKHKLNVSRGINKLLSSKFREVRREYESMRTLVLMQLQSQKKANRILLGEIQNEVAEKVRLQAILAQDTQRMLREQLLRALTPIPKQPQTPEPSDTKQQYSPVLNIPPPMHTQISSPILPPKPEQQHQQSQQQQPTHQSQKHSTNNSPDHQAHLDEFYEEHVNTVLNTIKQMKANFSELADINKHLAEKLETNQVSRSRANSQTKQDRPNHINIKAPAR